MEDLLPEKEGCEKDSDIDSDDDENPADVVLGGMPHDIGKNCHLSKASSQTSCKRMPS